MKIFSFLLSLLVNSLCLIGIALPVHANADFATNYQVTYKYDASGNSRIRHDVILTNKKSGLYASSFQIQVSGETPKNIVGQDGSGPLKITTDTKDGTTTLNLGFNQQITTLGGQLKFFVEYTGKPADHNGQVWEIFLPKVGKADFFDQYQLNLQIPPEFGQAAFISPNPANLRDNTYTFTKDQIAKIGVVAAFGNFQTYNFNLQYKIENPTNSTGITAIAIPADSNYQRITYDSIRPQPENVTTDAEGNWLATFKLQPNSTDTVQVTGQARILAEPSTTFYTSGDINPEDYVKPTQYWPSDDVEVKNIAQDLKTPRQVYNYIVAHLRYDQNRATDPEITRKGGKAALLDPTHSICMEFTDAFITLARAAGIPTREVRGYGYTTDTKLRPLSLASATLHAWPQYWDSTRKMWIDVDPTWEVTTGGINYFDKLDFNHFAFVGRGLSDSDPAFLASNVRVEYGSYKDTPSENTEVALKMPWQLWPLFPNTAKVVLSNNSGVAKYKTPVILDAINIAAQTTDIDVAQIPPYGRVEVPIHIDIDFWPNFRPQSISVTTAENELTYNVSVKLYIAWHVTIAIIIGGTLTALGSLAYAARSLYLQRSRA